MGEVNPIGSGSGSAKLSRWFRSGSGNPVNNVQWEIEKYLTSPSLKLLKTIPSLELLKHRDLRSSVFQFADLQGKDHSQLSVDLQGEDHSQLSAVFAQRLVDKIRCLDPVQRGAPKPGLIAA